MRKSKKQKMIDGLIEAQKAGTKRMVEAPRDEYVITPHLGDAVTVKAHGIDDTLQCGMLGFFSYQEMNSDPFYSEMMGLVGGCEAVRDYHTLINTSNILMIQETNKQNKEDER